MEAPKVLAPSSISSDAEHAAAVKQLIAWNQSPDAASRLAEIMALAEAVDTYEIAQGWEPEPPQTEEGKAELAAFIERMQARKQAPPEALP